MRALSVLVAMLFVGGAPASSRSPVPIAFATPPLEDTCRGKLAKWIVRNYDDVPMEEAAYIDYSIHLADPSRPRRLGPLVASGQADAHGFITIPSVPCDNYVLALSGVEETRTMMVLPYDEDPLWWFVGE
jgi:hypothetical protein